MKRFNSVTGRAMMSKTALSGAAIAGLVGSMLLTAQPARAESLLEDIGIGAAVGLSTGLILGEDFGVDDAVNGAAAGAACHVANKNWHDNDERNLAEDVAVGAVASTATGVLTNDDNLLSNAAQGAAACAAVNVID
jgi:catabolite regulation protein CreA